MDKGKAIELLKEALAELGQLRSLSLGNQKFDLWFNKVLDIIELASGKDSSEYDRFVTAVGVWRWDEEAYNIDLDSYETALKSVIRKYELLGVGSSKSHVATPRFSNHTLSYIVEILADHTDTELRNFFFKYNLLDIYEQSGRLTAKKRKVNDVFKHLSKIGDESVVSTLDSIVKETLREMIYTRRQLEEGAWKRFPQQFPELDAALRADGYQVHEGELIPVISTFVEPAKEEGLVEKLLDKYGFAIAKNHMKQSYENYLDGNWEAANAALRSFLQNVFDEIALIVAREEAEKREPGGERRKLLEEKGFIESATEARLVPSFFKFASHKGSHPGISNESDCRLRRYMAIALASYYLEKLEALHV